MRAGDVAALVEAHVNSDHKRFSTVARTIAANERHSGRNSMVADRIDRALGGGEAGLTLGREAAKFVLPVTSENHPVLEPSTRAAVDRIVAEHLAHERLDDAGLQAVSSALFVGPPGVGKTMAATVIGQSAGLDTFVVSTESVVDSLLGGTGNNLRTLFDEICSHPAVWVFDEFDSLARGRGGSNDVKESDRIVNTILRMMDRPRRGLIVGCTNLPDLLDPAIVSRFETTVAFGPPSSATIQQIIATTLGRIPSTADPATLAARFEGIASHRELVATIRRAAKAAVMEGRSVDIADIDTVAALP